MKKWVSIPVSILSSLLPGCGKENETVQSKVENDAIAEKIKDKDRVSMLTRAKEPSDCGFSKSSKE